MSKKHTPEELTLPKRLLQAVHTGQGDHLLLHARLVVGVSGGADSVALLGLLREVRGSSAEGTLHVAHLNHGFRGSESEADANFVRDLASAWGLPFTERVADVPTYARLNRLSAEAAARDVRYSFLSALAREQGAAIATGHSADDQAETVLLHLLRGTGIEGLRGMLPVTDLHIKPDDQIGEHELGTVTLFRPLLSIWRTEVEEYCHTLNVVPRRDSSNENRRYTRNRIRHELLPLLEREYNARIKSHLLTLAQIASQENDAIETLTAKEWLRLAVPTPGNSSVRFEQSEFAELSLAIQRRLARRAILEVAGTLDGITFEHISQVASALSGSGPPSRIDLPLNLTVAQDAGTGYVFRRTGATTGQPFVPIEEYRWPLMNPGETHPLLPNLRVDLQGGWELSVTEQPVAAPLEPGPLLTVFDSTVIRQHGEIVLRTRASGDYIEPLGMIGRKSLQDLMVDAKMPQSIRGHVPVLAFAEAEGLVLWVPGPGGKRSRIGAVGPETVSLLVFEYVRQSEGEGNESA